MASGSKNRAADPDLAGGLPLLSEVVERLGIGLALSYAQTLIVVIFFRFFGFSFCRFLDVSGRFGGPGGVKTAPGDLLGRVLTNFHPNRITGDPKATKNQPSQRVLN